MQPAYSIYPNAETFTKLEEQLRINYLLVCDKIQLQLNIQKDIQFARTIGISQSQFSGVRRGETPSLAMILKLIAHYNVNANEIFGTVPTPDIAAEPDTPAYLPKLDDAVAKLAAIAAQSSKDKDALIESLQEQIRLLKQRNEHLETIIEHYRAKKDAPKK